MTICFVNADGSHVRGCEAHRGAHPYDWCVEESERRLRRIDELQKELSNLINAEFIADFSPTFTRKHVYQQGDNDYGYRRANGDLPKDGDIMVARDGGIVYEAP